MRDNQYPDPFETERVGHPKKPNQSLGVEVLRWYYPNRSTLQQRKRERVGHPPAVQGSRREWFQISRVITPRIWLWLVSYKE
jgi:hypothetical protein